MDGVGWKPAEEGGGSSIEMTLLLFPVSQLRMKRLNKDVCQVLYFSSSSIFFFPVLLFDVTEK